MELLPLLITVLVLQLVQLGATLWLVRRRRPEGVQPAALTSLAEQLEPPLRKLFGQLEAEQARARELVVEAERLLAALRTEPPATSEAVADDEPQQARGEARRLLGEGRAVGEVAEQTGLPIGEVQVLANLLSARGRA
ncbi:MAG: hypothetical protein HUU35_06415 [Armatimonadetes bacterium]|nr:hypothetical protein [Armatimonadota bacterium]